MRKIFVHKTTYTTLLQKAHNEFLKKKVFLTHSAFARLSEFASFFICRRTLVLYVECEPIKTVQYKNSICRMRAHNTGTKQPL